MERYAHIAVGRVSANPDLSERFQGEKPRKSMLSADMDGRLRTMNLVPEEA